MSKQHNRRGFPAVLTGTAIIAGLLVAAVMVGLELFGMPFTTRTIDRSPPPVLVQLRDLAEYHAAQAQFEVTIDQEQDVKWLPSAIAGERVQFVGVGAVDAVVDFGDLTDGAITVGTDRTSVAVALPAVAVQQPVLDHQQSHVMNRDRGVLNRVAGVFSDNPTSEDGLYRAAMAKMAAAAAATDLRRRAEENTRAMLTALLHSLGYGRVDVTFGPPWRTDQLVA
jgi:hypothetical protein